MAAKIRRLSRKDSLTVSRRILNRHGPVAVNYIAAILSDPGASRKDKRDAAFFIAEQVVGKPKQQVDMGVDSPFAKLCEMLNQGATFKKSARPMRILAEGNGHDSTEGNGDDIEGADEVIDSLDTEEDSLGEAVEEQAPAESGSTPNDIPPEWTHRYADLAERFRSLKSKGEVKHASEDQKGGRVSRKSRGKGVSQKNHKGKGRKTSKSAEGGGTRVAPDREAGKKKPQSFLGEG